MRYNEALKILFEPRVPVIDESVSITLNFIRECTTNMIARMTVTIHRKIAIKKYNSSNLNGAIKW